MIDAGAIFDLDRKYRYHLWRSWGTGRRCLFIMLNPSTADEKILDPTLRRCVSFAQRWGYEALDVCNLFAFRSTDPRVLYRCGDGAIGLDNDRWIIKSAHRADLIICAWGRHGSFLTRNTQVLDILHDFPLFCLGRNADGSPMHPLYRPAAQQPEPLKKC